LTLRTLPDLADGDIAGGDPTEWHSYNRVFDLRKPLDWHAAEGERWPLRHHARINYRPGNPHGDVRIAWELSRLQFLPALVKTEPALAIWHLTDWLACNPYRIGQAWISAMEVAIRWVSIYRTACWLPDVPPRLAADLVGLGRASGRFIESHLSTGSSAGNHLILEALGLVWIGHALGDGRRLARGRQILEAQILRQVHPDGTSIEQTFWYLGFVVDAGLHWILIDGERVPQAVRERLHAALGFISAVVCGEANPDFGDRDDGVVQRVRADYAESHFTYLQAAGSACLGPPPPPQTVYPDGGVTVLPSGPGLLLFRHAPLGMPPIFGHGHAAALSLILTWGETPLLIDPGSGQYNGDQTVRDYFRSTRAHNTVGLGGQDQAQMLGTFLWERSWSATLLSAGDGYAEASCDAYVDRYGVLLRRRVGWQGPRRVIVRDVFEGPAGVAAEGTWQIEGEVSVVDGVVVGRTAAAILRLTPPAGTRVSLHRGETEPMLGWRSPRYGVWQPCTTVVVAGRTGRAWETAIEIS